MYLKSLVLKGFKSFADRSVLTLEPGLSAIVGPNGSGKSNISDAVLWVLGERNAKNLRGQLMEDVIFAGSSARKAVNLAEVTLVLDNSDGMLPIDYDEVSISRRMYRNGESECLINGSIVRRLDVLDILHDSGLGTGTHSIISQGQLDAILQSKPEERRALIEETAGILKHKQRKEKSARKLQAMDDHLTRVRDIAAEVNRRLGPLERKAKRAQSYMQLRDELRELELELAVDDLRILRRSWNAAQERERALSKELADRRAEVEDAQEESDEIMRRLREEQDASLAFNERRNRTVSSSERLSSSSALIREKGASSMRRLSEVASNMEANASSREELLIEKKKAEEELASILESIRLSESKLEDAQKAFDASNEEYRRLENESSSLERIARESESHASRLREDASRAQEALVRERSQAELLSQRSSDFATRLDQANEAFESARTHAEETRERHIAASRDAEAAEKALGEALASRSSALEVLEAVRSDIAGLEAEIKALEEADRIAAASAGSARAWLIERADEFGASFASASDYLRVDESYEALIESLMGEDVRALTGLSRKNASHVEERLRTSMEQGGAAIAFGASLDRIAESARETARRSGGIAAIDLVSAECPFATEILSLIADIVICPSVEAAIAAHDADREGLRFASESGFVIGPNGKALIGADVLDKGEGSLARRRRLDAAKRSLEETRARLVATEKELDSSRIAAEEAQSAYLSARSVASEASGEALGAQTALAKAERELKESGERKLALDADAEKARAGAGEAEDALMRLEAKRDEARMRFESARESWKNATEALAPARFSRDAAMEALQEARLSLHSLSDRKRYGESALSRIGLSIAEIDRRDKALRAERGRMRVLASRSESLAIVLDGLCSSAQRRLDALEREALAIRGDGGSSSAGSEASAKRLKEARSALDATTERLNELRIEIGRLEVQVETSANHIVKDLSVPLESALSREPLEDRPFAEDEAARLRRRIANMGTINPDAADEFAEVKERADYLNTQLADLSSARAALERIDKVIEERMKQDFIECFEKVNENFKEIFRLLFPGGEAELSLTDPEDLETTGVEVNAQPSGKKITKMSLMSGGEKSLVALALLFASYRTRSTPFYLLDEVEAALDDSNLSRLMNYLSALRASTQLIMITHQRRTMEMADVLFGVTMQADGVTKVVSQRLSEALEMAE